MARWTRRKSRKTMLLPANRGLTVTRLTVRLKEWIRRVLTLNKTSIKLVSNL